MSFGLKNVEATYQCLVNMIFKDLIGKSMEVYMDDMIIKSSKAEDHVEDLLQAFEELSKHGIKFNPKKCVFRVKARKFLGFIVS